MSTTLLLARHGETDWNAEGRYQGLRDIPLNAAGREQAAALAASLADIKIAAVYASHLRRAVETATAVAIYGSQIIDSLEGVGLAEINHGEWEGLLASEVERRWPDLMKEWRNSPHTVRMPGGETLKQVQGRARKALARILAANEGKTIFVCSHDAVIRALLCDWLEMPLSAFWRLRQDATALNVIQFESGTPRVCVVNNLAHLGKTWSVQDHAAK